jgi:hypothetical protein
MSLDIPFHRASNPGVGTLGVVSAVRNRYLMQNLGEEFEQFRPGPSRDELNHMLNLPK